MIYPVLIEEAMAHLSSLPGIGKKTALRLLLHLLRREKEGGLALSKSLEAMILGVRYCARCHGLSEGKYCAICVSERRNLEVCCVVGEVQDLLAIESTGQYEGVYHVLGGMIIPERGILPDKLFIDDLPTRIQSEGIKEICFALSDTLHGHTTMHYLSKLLQESDLGVRLTQIARGVPMGSELEFTDMLTLGRSIADRRAYEQLNEKVRV